MFPGLNARVHNRCCRGPGAGIECSLDAVLQMVCRLQTLITSHKCHTSMSSDTRVSHLTSMCSDDLPSRWVASYLCLTSLKCHSHDDLQHFRRTFWGKPDIPCWREASHRPPPPKPVLAMSMIAQQVCVLQISSDCHPTRKGHTACKSCWLKAYLH